MLSRLCQELCQLASGPATEKHSTRFFLSWESQAAQADSCSKASAAALSTVGRAPHPRQCTPSGADDSGVWHELSMYSSGHAFALLTLLGWAAGFSSSGSMQLQAALELRALRP